MLFTMQVVLNIVYFIGGKTSLLGSWFGFLSKKNCFLILLITHIKHLETPTLGTSMQS